MSKNLVISPTGNRSLFKNWISGNKDFDIVLLCYEDINIDLSHFFDIIKYGDLFIERNSKVQYAFLPSTTGPTSEGTWYPITATGTSAPTESFMPGFSETVLIQSYENYGTPPNPNHGALWFNTDTGVLYTYIAGETGAFANAWVQATVINNTIQALPS